MIGALQSVPRISDIGLFFSSLFTRHSSLRFLALISLHPARPYLEFAISNLRPGCCPIPLGNMGLPLVCCPLERHTVRKTLTLALLYSFTLADVRLAVSGPWFPALNLHFRSVECGFGLFTCGIRQLKSLFIQDLARLVAVISV